MTTKSDKPNPNARPRPASVKGASPVQATSAAVWKAKTSGGTLVTVPSGSTVLMKTPGMQAFITGGAIPNNLLPIIRDAMKSGELDESKMADTLLEPDKIEAIVQLADAVTVYCCIEPQVHPTPRDENNDPLPSRHPDRDPNLLYADEVDFNDKMFIFNVAVGGTADLERFRQG